MSDSPEMEAQLDQDAEDYHRALQLLMVKTADRWLRICNEGGPNWEGYITKQWANDLASLRQLLSEVYGDSRRPKFDDDKSEYAYRLGRVHGAIDACDLGTGSNPVQLPAGRPGPSESADDLETRVSRIEQMVWPLG